MSKNINAAEINQRFIDSGVEADRIKAGKDALRAALTALEFKDIRETRNGCITVEDVEGLTIHQLRWNLVDKLEGPYFVGCIQRNHGRIRFGNLDDLTDEVGPAIKLPANSTAETTQAVEQNMSVLKIVRPNGQEVEMTIGEVGYFFWSLLDDLYLAKGMKFIKKTIGGGCLSTSKRKQLELAIRFLHVLGFETGEDEFSNDQVVAIKALLAAS